MIEFVDVTDLKPVGDYRLWVQFSNGAEGVCDLGDVVARGGEMIEPLSDKTFFAKVFLHHTVPSWPNGYEIDSTALHMDMDAAGLLGSPVPLSRQRSDQGRRQST